MQTLILKSKYTTQYLIGVKVNQHYPGPLHNVLPCKAILQGMLMLPLKGDPLVKQLKQITVSAEEEMVANLIKLRDSTLQKQEKQEQVLLQKVIIDHIGYS